MRRRKRFEPISDQLGDLFVSASTSETQGLTYVEALAGGLPLVCRRDPCLAGVLEHGKNGYSYRTREEFADYVKRVLKSETMQEQMGEYSRKLARTFGTEAFGQAVNDLYQNSMREHVPAELPVHLFKLRKFI